MAEDLPPLPKGKFFYIIGRESGLVLEIQGANLEPGALVVLGHKRHIRDEAVESLCQMWYNCLVTKTIRSRANANLALTLNDDDQLAVDIVHEEEGRYMPTERQSWQFNIKRGLIRAQIDGENRFIDVADHATDAGSAIIGNEETGEDNQLFEAEYLDQPYFMIVSEMSGLCLEVSTGLFGGVKEGQDLVTSKLDGKEQQLWYEDEDGVLRCKAEGYAVQVAEREPGSELQTAIYSRPRETQQWHHMPNGMICNREHPQFVFDIEGRKKKDGAKIIIWEYKGSDNQQWRKDTNIPVKKKKAKKTKKKKTKKVEEEEESEDDDEDSYDDDD